MKSLCQYQTILAMVLGGLLFGCLGDHEGINTGNGLVVGSGSSTGESALTLAATGSDGHAVDVQEAWANIRDIRIDLPAGSDCGDIDLEGADPLLRCEASRLVVDGPIVVDLIAREATPSLANLGIPNLTYRRVDIRFDSADPDDGLIGADDPLAGAALIATGNMAHDGGNVAYFLSLDFSEDARFESDAGVRLDDQDLLAHLDAGLWFADVPLGTCHDDGEFDVLDGVVQVQDSSGACSAVENSIKESIKTSGQLDKVD